MTGLKAFLLIFMMMPLGHALMVVMNRHLDEQIGWGATSLFLAGCLLVLGTRWTRSSAWQSFLGAFAGVLLWTGAVEYGLLYAATVLGIAEVNGTAGEYRLMMHTWSFLLLLVLYLVMHESIRCNLFIWLRKKLHLTAKTPVTGTVINYGPRTAFEMISILWFFYVLLLLLYDETLLGVHHLLTYACLVLSLAFGMWLFVRLLRIKDMGFAIRYAIPTVIIIWNVVEITAKWGLYEEPWLTLDPAIMVVICMSFVAGVALVVRELVQPRSQRLDPRS
ncbi:MAG: hypothetical protein GY894_09210 [Planctomycetes bacterium]|nr:hypothetical protein [Planctomycetota bacterium]MCP4839521.1 hypothetical protein [Planctomycetota bacterium]